MKGIFKKKKTNTSPSRREEARARQAQAQRGTQVSDERYTFRRNYTITGSSSSSVKSLSEANATLKSPRVHAHHLARQRRHIGLALGTVLVVCVSLFIIVSQYTAGIVTSINGDSSIQPRSDYTETLQAYFGVSPLERLRFMTNEKQLQRYVQTSHPEVASVSIDGGAGFGKTQVQIVTRKPVASWQIGGQRAYVDTTGRAFSINYYPETLGVSIIDNSGITLERARGREIASDAFLSFVGRVVGLTKKLTNYRVGSVTIPRSTTRQIEIRLKGVAYPIRLSSNRGVGEQVEDMDRAIQWFNKRGVSPQYLDVRVERKVFYR